jgi:hypothetical protein
LRSCSSPTQSNFAMSDAHTLNQDESRSEPKPERKLPDVAICRARHSGFGDYADCLVDNPRSCPYALSFGKGHFCRNPQREEIVARTEAKQRK